MKKTANFDRKISKNYIERNIACLWIGRLNTVKMSVLPDLFNRVNATSIKTPACYFVDINKLIHKVTWRGKRSKIAKLILQEGMLTLPNFKAYYNATVLLFLE